MQELKLNLHSDAGAAVSGGMDYGAAYVKKYMEMYGQMVGGMMVGAPAPPPGEQAPAPPQKML